MTATITIEIEDDEYELTVSSHSPPSRGSRDEPPDGGEVDFSPVVWRRTQVGSQRDEEVTFEEFVSRYAGYLGVSIERADRRARDDAMVELGERAADAWEDHLESSDDEDERWT